jgi:hypothetical protein
MQMWCCVEPTFSLTRVTIALEKEPCTLQHLEILVSFNMHTTNSEMFGMTAEFILRQRT